MVPALRSRPGGGVGRPAVVSRFCGFGLDDGTPDETTFCRFRAALAERGLAETLLAELNRQLDAKGLVLKAGTLIDATLLEAAAARPPVSEGKVSTKDPEAGFTRRGQTSVFGFKAHLPVDRGSGLVRDAILTGADVGDSLAVNSLGGAGRRDHRVRG